MPMIEKAYEYWGSENGRPVKKVTSWFKWTGQDCPEWQLKNRLKNFYREV